MLQQQLQLHIGSVSPHLMNQLHQQHRLHHPVQRSAGYLSGFQSHLFNPHLSSSSSVSSKYDHRPKSTQNAKHSHRLSHQGSNASSQKSESSSLQFRSKYMTSDEIESILRLQLAVTHSNDPYIDDYYHQGRLAKKTFCGKPTCLKAAWELMEIFYVDKQSQAWLPERLVDWLADYDSLFTSTQETIHGKLVDFQNDLVNIQVIEDDPRYWEVMSSALSVGWLDIVVKMLRLHGSYQLDQLSYRELENGLVEAVAVLISKMPRLRHESAVGNLGDCFKSKPDFIKAWEKWRSQITKLDCSPFWIQCDNQQTREGLRNLLQVMLGNTESLCTTSCYWIELYISHFLYIRPFTTGIESMYNLAQKCIQLKPPTGTHRLAGLMIGILAENTEVVLAEISREFGPWMVLTSTFFCHPSTRIKALMPNVVVS
ncbi:nuclear pore complex protein NUP85-like [Lathyrus oleraceus]|uniref:nuclear pore complex protein NUP85-like n=1 Tax=Pisum sativum TaxID=3888 RepID=UPI0021D0EA57|nr:nuclear pore complex protein NUP85-like [Pisum sativum]